jgi:ankyrin repeat protein
MGIFSKLFGDNLISAAKKGDIGKVQELLNNGCDPNEREYGFSALMFACERGHKDAVQLLVERGADANAKEPSQALTPLMAACSGKGFVDASSKEERALEIAKLLVQHGADVNAVGKGGQTADKFASEAGHQKVLQFLAENGANGANA